MPSREMLYALFGIYSEAIFIPVQIWKTCSFCLLTTINGMRMIFTEFSER